ncbi:metallophosphoesterase [Dickeya dadantii]|uniref:metallophosphoesterase n=1 Tax=Dickeya dadantii TaxID=204038 RepID=UPI001495A5C9|nr:metallophosphoesterase [Dickeya dadantii]NPE55982.1 metallophosphoesterase [Dickeya dadantii]NPE68076.1 metallophosphoesterase [Dickeya dadantii]
MLILHLSDIHFRKSEVSTAQDPNAHLRNEIIRDAESQCALLGHPDVIIVSGDIAFAGDPDEFKFATEWLEILCNACGCSLTSVFVVPGNHDVVRSIADSYYVQLAHRAIKAAANPLEEIGIQMRQLETQSMLYRSLDNYNQFASQFFCNLLPPERTRATRELTLNDGSTLRLWGLNSAFLSSSSDREGELFIDPASMQIMRSSGVVNLVVTHHHLSWLGQARDFEDHINDVAPIQIFGHVHLNRIDMNRDYVRLTASAANPDRHEGGWEPGYNLIEVSVNGKPNDRMLNIRAHVRVWQTAPGGFQAKMDRRSPVFEQHIKLEPWEASLVVAQAVEAQSIDFAAVKTIEEGDTMDPLRDLGLRFYKLSFSKKLEIAGRLELLDEEDMHLPDHERFRCVLIRAHERGKTEQLADAVTIAEQG